MSTIIKSISVTWSWSGDTSSIKSFNVALTKDELESDPNGETIAKATVDGNSTGYIFNNLLLDDSFDYEAWVQASYIGKDSDWISQGSLVVSDDGTATVSHVFTFTVEPTGPYKIGDVWLENGIVKKCVVANSGIGEFLASDWEIVADEAAKAIENDIDIATGSLKMSVEDAGQIVKWIKMNPGNIEFWHGNFNSGTAYSTGTINIDNGETIVVGNSTLWVTNGIDDNYEIAMGGGLYHVVSVEDETHLNIEKPYLGTDLLNETYNLFEPYLYNAVRRIEIGEADTDVDVIFDPPFLTIPKVIVSPKSVKTYGRYYDDVDQTIECYYENLDINGFTPKIATKFSDPLNVHSYNLDYDLMIDGSSWETEINTEDQLLSVGSTDWRTDYPNVYKLSLQMYSIGGDIGVYLEFKDEDGSYKPWIDPDTASQVGTTVINGLVEVTNGSAIVTGTATTWSADVDMTYGTTYSGAGQYFCINGTFVRVLSVDSDIQLTLESNWVGDSGNNLSYQIGSNLYIETSMIPVIDSTKPVPMEEVNQYTVQVTHFYGTRSDINLSSYKEYTADRSGAIAGTLNYVVME